jgi:hypothetical protein
MDADSHCLAIDFPLRGEWTALQTPAHRIPSHGTDRFAQRYAFDFLRLNWKWKSANSGSIFRHLLGKTSVQNSYSWARPVHAPFSGTVAVARDGWPERTHLNLIKDIYVAMGNRHKRVISDIQALAGNYVIIQSGSVFALLAHLRYGSIRVSAHEKVESGQIIGEAGHSGNSTSPHLHFHLMDGIDPITARGMPCCFRSYERWTQNRWQRVQNGIPNRLERIRL